MNAILVRNLPSVPFILCFTVHVSLSFYCLTATTCIPDTWRDLNVQFCLAIRVTLALFFFFPCSRSAFIISLFFFIFIDHLDIIIIVRKGMYCGFSLLSRWLNALAALFCCQIIHLFYYLFFKIKDRDRLTNFFLDVRVLTVKKVVSICVPMGDR